MMCFSSRVELWEEASKRPTSIHSPLPSATVGGNVSVNSVSENLGGGAVILASSIGGNFTMSSGNAVEIVGISASSIGGNAQFMLNNGDNVVTIASSLIGGGLTILAGSGNDDIVIDSFVSRSAYLSLSGGDNSLQLGLGGFIGSTLTMVTGSGDDLADFEMGSIVAGSMNLNLSNGDNRVDFGGNLFGPSFSYFGGAGVDSVTFEATSTAAQSRVTMFLGAGNDELTLAVADMAFLFADFGIGTDILTGSLPLRYFLFNLP